jgi:putative Mg2+ transporter-C (MgtC) family protein
MTWQAFWDHYINLEPGVLEISLRLGCAMLVGLIIGIEREYTHRPAGMRTHILVALGACVVSIVGEMLFTQYHVTGATPDPARLSAQVITGVGFLGAGTIMKEGPTVKGLTTAASLWAVACLGLASGFGYYSLALLGMAFIMITLTVFEVLQRGLIRTGSSSMGYSLETKDITLSLKHIYTIAQEQNVTLSDVEAEQIPNGHRLNFRVVFSGRHKKKHRQQFFNTLAAAEETLSLTTKDKQTV